MATPELRQCHLHDERGWWTPFSQQKGLYFLSVMHSVGDFLPQKRKLQLPMGLKASIPEADTRKCLETAGTPNWTVWNLCSLSIPLKPRVLSSFSPSGKAEWQENSNPHCRLTKPKPSTHLSGILGTLGELCLLFSSWLSRVSFPFP